MVSDYVKQGIRQAGGTPVEFGVIAACDGIAQGHEGMHYILPTRDLIANDVEMMIQAHRLDAVVLLCSCDKIVPGMLMAAARLDLPAIVVVGGPMEGGCEFDGRAADVTSLTEALGMLNAGKIDEDTFRWLEDGAGPTLRLLLFSGHGQHDVLRRRGDGHVPARQRDHPRHARRPPARRPGIRPPDRRAAANKGSRPATIINGKGIENAIRVSTAIGGSTNAALHIPAIAYEADCCEITMDVFEELCRSTPHIAKMNPAAPANVPDFHAAGGVPAVMNEILPLLHGDALTVSGKTVAENVAGR